MATNIKFDEKYTNIIDKKCNKIIILDIETDGKVSVVQIAYTICDKNLNIIKSESILINNGPFIVDFFCRFEYSTIREKGLSPIGALEIFKTDFQECDYVVGHNVSWDLRILHRYAEMKKINFDIVGKVYSDMKIIDTMRVSKKLLDLKNRRGGIKPPKLSELFSYLNNNNEENINEQKQHTADYDVKTTMKCVLSLINMKVIINE